MKRWMALDVGTRRIGVAVSDPLKLTARPVATVERRSLSEDVAAIVELGIEHEVEKIVVGRPQHFDGRPAPLVEEISRLAQALQAQSPWDFVWANETLSSREAEQLLARLRVPAEKRRQRRDEIAAALILQWYLDEVAG